MEICGDTYENIITTLTGSSNPKDVYESFGSLQLPDVLSTILLTLNTNTFVGIQVESTDETMERFYGNVGHVFSIIKIDPNKYNLVQTYINYYCQPRYTTLCHHDLVEMIIQLCELYTTMNNAKVKNFYRKWFHVDLNDQQVAHLNYIKITTL